MFEPPDNEPLGDGQFRNRESDISGLWLRQILNFEVKFLGPQGVSQDFSDSEVLSSRTPSLRRYIQIYIYIYIYIYVYIYIYICIYGRARPVHRHQRRGGGGVPASLRAPSHTNSLTRMHLRSRGTFAEPLRMPSHDLLVMCVCVCLIAILSWASGKAELCFLWVSHLFNTLFQNFAWISPEIHRNFTRIYRTSPELHQNFTGISQYVCQNIELEHLKKGITSTQPSHTRATVYAIDWSSAWLTCLCRWCPSRQGTASSFRGFQRCSQSTVFVGEQKTRNI